MFYVFSKRFKEGQWHDNFHACTEDEYNDLCADPNVDIIAIRVER